MQKCCLATDRTAIGENRPGSQIPVGDEVAAQEVDREENENHSDHEVEAFPPDGIHPLSGFDGGKYKSRVQQPGANGNPDKKGHQGRQFIVDQSAGLDGDGRLGPKNQGHRIGNAEQKPVNDVGKVAFAFGRRRLRFVVVIARHMDALFSIDDAEHAEKYQNRNEKQVHDVKKSRAFLHQAQTEERKTTIDALSENGTKSNAVTRPAVVVHGRLKNGHVDRSDRNRDDETHYESGDEC